MKNNFQEKYDKLHKVKFKILLRSLILILFLVGVNIFAWFTFLSKAGLELSGNVISWDIEFNTDDKQTTDVIVDITDMKPGMTDYEKEVTIHNKGEAVATFSYKIKELTILGKEVDVTDSEAVATKLESYYPFIIKFSFTKDDISTDDYSQFVIKAIWSYEEDVYYQLDDLYDYDETFSYYKLSGNEYTIDSSITSDNYLTNRSSIYLAKDDADTYFGEQCGSYEESTDDVCIHMKVQLIAQQKN